MPNWGTEGVLNLHAATHIWRSLPGGKMCLVAAAGQLASKQGGAWKTLCPCDQFRTKAAEGKEVRGTEGSQGSRQRRVVDRSEEFAQTSNSE